MKTFTRNLLGASAFAALLLSTVGPGFAAEVIVKVAPPSLRAEVRPPERGADFAWRPGYWRWAGTEHVWVAGDYERRPHPGAEWEAGRWEPRGEGHVWVDGRWK